MSFYICKNNHLEIIGKLNFFRHACYKFPWPKFCENTWNFKHSLERQVTWIYTDNINITISCIIIHTVISDKLLEGFYGGSVVKNARQQSPVQSPAQEDSTYRRAMKPIHHSYWNCAPDPERLHYWAHVPQGTHVSYSPCSARREAQPCEATAL